MTKRRSRTSPVQAGLVTPKRVGILLLFAAALWVGWGFAQKMLVAYRLNSEVQQLQRQNAQLAEANRQYTQQLQALSKPEGAEEEARLHNYVKPDEKVYIIAAAPTPSPKPSSGGSKTGSAGSNQRSWWDSFWHVVTGK